MNPDASGESPDLDHRSDEELVAAANGGEGAAFEALYRRHRDWVVSLAFRFTGRPDLALDVLQETFLYLLRKFPGFRLTARITTFLYPAVKNLSIAARRQERRFDPGGSETPFDEIPSRPPEEPEGARSELSVALASLSLEQRETVLLRFADDCSLAEIAAALGVPLGTVKSRLHNALAALRADPAAGKYFLE